MRLWGNLLIALQVAICYCIIVIGQALWKLGLIKYRITGLQFKQYLPKYLLSNYFIFGSVAYIIATVIWIYLLSKYEFNKLYPMNSIGYVLALLLSAYVFHEYIPTNRFIGVAIIIIGIIVLSLK